MMMEIEIGIFKKSGPGNGFCKLTGRDPDRENREKRPENREDL